MWSHYANSYAGICIEYDFGKIEDFIGFIYPISYTKKRPMVSMSDLGIEGLRVGSEISIESSEPNMSAIISYLLAKNECWRYEEEWRIINIGEANMPVFVDLPFVKSITFGLNIDSMCKQLLWDVCQEKNINCYDVFIDTEDYTLSRKQLSEEDFVYDLDKEVEYINILTQQMENISVQMETNGEEFVSNGANSDFSKLKPMLSDAIDMLTNAYFLKMSLNRVCDNTEEYLSLIDMPEEIFEAVTQVNLFVHQVREINTILYETVPGLRLKGVLSSADYKLIKKQLDNLQELVEKFDGIEWNPIYERN